MTQEDFNDLLNAAVEHAAELLTQDSEFAPFALAMQADDGEVFHLEPDNVEAATDPEHVVVSLRAGLCEALARWRAVAVVADVTLEDDDGELVTAAIHVALEHLVDEPITCLVPYAIEDEKVELDDLVFEPGARHIFPEAAQA